MNLASFGEELRRIRQEKQISLMDISASTRISQKFLEAIESGRFSILPETYMRAILREYAAAIDLDPDDILKRYDGAAGGGSTVAEPRHTIEKSAVSRAFDNLTGRRWFPLALRKNVVFTGVLVLALIISLYLLNSGSRGPSQPTSEVHFDNVVKETEAAAIRNDTSPPSPLPAAISRPDSLILEMSTTDSVWMTILIDGNRTEEYLFPPHRKKKWMGQDEFRITMGNAGGATFVLNGKEIGKLGKRGAVVRNAVIGGSTLKNL